MTIVHRNSSKQRTIAGKNWRRTASAEPEVRGAFDVISPMKIAGDVCRKHRLTLVSSASARANTRTDADAVHDSIVFLRHGRSRSVAQALCRLVKDKHCAHHSVTRLRFDAADQHNEHRRQRCTGGDLRQYSFLVCERVLRALALRYIAKAPYTANVTLLDQLNCRIALENAAVFQLQYIKSFGRRRRDNLIDTRQIRSRVFQLRTDVIPQLAGMS